MPLPGKFGRIRKAGVNLGYLHSWRARFRREPLDTTNFETTTDGVNVGEEQETGTLATFFNVEGYVDATAGVNVLYPSVRYVWDFLYRKDVALGFQGVTCDMLGWEPGTGVKQVATFTAELKVNGLVSGAV